VDYDYGHGWTRMPSGKHDGKLLRDRVTCDALIAAKAGAGRPMAAEAHKKHTAVRKTASQRMPPPRM
jgi:hypothetical protein